MSKATKVVKNPTTAPGIKYGGRSKGTPNRSSMTVAELCESMGVNVIQNMIYFAEGDWKALGYASETVIKPGFAGIEIEELTIPQDLRYKANADLLKYIAPQRKSIEHKVDSDTSKAITFNYIEPKNDKP